MNIFLSAPINNLSYGIVSYEILKELSKNHKIYLNPIGGMSSEYSSDFDVINSYQNFHTLYSYKEINSPFPSLRIFHQFDLHSHIGKGPRIGFPFFEVTKFSNLEKTSMSLNDLLFVSSKWGKNILEENNIKIPKHVIPLGVNNKIFYPSPNRTENCVFLNIGKLEHRKGKDILIKAFQLFAQNKNDVKLWMMVDTDFVPLEKLNTFKKECKKILGNKIIFFPKVKTQYDIASIINSANYGIFPYRAEGWNLPLLECMACGLNVAATNYSAPTEYINQKNCFLLGTNELEPAIDNMFFSGLGEWAKIDTTHYIDQVIYYFEKSYSTWLYNREDINNAGIETSREFSWQRTAENIIKCLISYH